MLKFFSKMSVKSRTQLSLAGIDPKTLYVMWRDNWYQDMCILLMKNREVVGTCKLTEVTYPENGVYLSCFAILDEYQDSGLGTKLMKYAFAVAILNGQKRIYLEVKLNNSRAKAFFERCGFKVTKKKEIVYWMEKKLHEN